ncbi:hypothetical protein PROFUN_08540 [Planoprotostelium fungivorum]|uniref:Uncharacterized protein n=1 Tax=Planoprotostelium fungivorum TaxID=1890364 RepID=A0A2P6N1M1_9EUKA|nr:hypothetical protein PROFUN_08540 [Planoprotostelium fungivorum]
MTEEATTTSLAVETPSADGSTATTTLPPSPIRPEVEDDSQRASNMDTQESQETQESHDTQASQMSSQAPILNKQPAPGSLPVLYKKRKFEEEKINVGQSLRVIPKARGKLLARIPHGGVQRIRRHDSENSEFFREEDDQEGEYDEHDDPDGEGAFKTLPLSYQDGHSVEAFAGPDASTAVVMNPDGTMQQLPKPKRPRKKKDLIMGQDPSLSGHVDPETGHIVEAPVVTELQNPKRKGTRAKLQRWTMEEDEMLMKLVPNTKITQEQPYFWRNIAKEIPGKTINQCFQHWHRVLNPEIKKGPWTPEDEEELVNIVNQLKSEPRHLWSRVAAQTRGRIDTQCRYQMKLIENSASVEWEAVEDDAIVAAVKKDNEKNGNNTNWVDIAHTFNTRMCRINARNTPIRAAMHIKQRYNMLLEQRPTYGGHHHSYHSQVIPLPQDGQAQARAYATTHSHPAQRQQGGAQGRNMQAFETLGMDEYVSYAQEVPADGGEVQEEELAAGLLVGQLEESHDHHTNNEASEGNGHGQAPQGESGQYPSDSKPGVSYHNSEEAENLLSLQERENYEGSYDS